MEGWLGVEEERLHCSLVLKSFVNFVHTPGRRPPLVSYYTNSKKQAKHKIHVHRNPPPFSRRLMWVVLVDLTASAADVEEFLPIEPSVSTYHSPIAPTRTKQERSNSPSSYPPSSADSGRTPPPSRGNTDTSYSTLAAWGHSQYL